MEAIAKNKKLNRAEKAVLHTIASQMKVGGNFTDDRWMFIADIVDRTGFSRRTVFRTIKSLRDNQYLRVRQQMDNRGKTLTASVYNLTSRVFCEYQELLVLRLVDRDTGATVAL